MVGPRWWPESTFVQPPFFFFFYLMQNCYEEFDRNIKHFWWARGGGLSAHLFTCIWCQCFSEKKKKKFRTSLVTYFCSKFLLTLFSSSWRYMLVKIDNAFRIRKKCLCSFSTVTISKKQSFQDKTWRVLLLQKILHSPTSAKLFRFCGSSPNMP